MDDEPILYRNSKPKGGAKGQTQISGAIVFWFIMSSLLGILAIASFVGNLSSGSYSASTSMAMFAAAIWFIYSLITMILVGGKSGRLFIAISHIVFSILALIFCIIILVQLGQVNSYAFRSYMAKSLMDTVNTILTFSACLYLIAFCFYMIYGLYFLSADGALRWYSEKRSAQIENEAEYKVPSKNKKQSSVKIHCANCNAEINASMKFCPECGAELDWGN